jgi:hypothetical protein
MKKQLFLTCAFALLPFAIQATDPHDRWPLNRHPKINLSDLMKANYKNQAQQATLEPAQQKKPILLAQQSIQNPSRAPKKPIPSKQDVPCISRSYSFSETAGLIVGSVCVTGAACWYALRSFTLFDFQNFTFSKR